VRVSTPTCAVLTPRRSCVRAPFLPICPCWLSGLQSQCYARIVDKLVCKIDRWCLGVFRSGVAQISFILLRSPSIASQLLGLLRASQLLGFSASHASQSFSTSQSFSAYAVFMTGGKHRMVYIYHVSRAW
jgi:hypothetical protein